MIDIDFNNISDHLGWIQIQEMTMWEDELIELQTWCNETFGHDGVGIVRRSSTNVNPWFAPAPTRRRRVFQLLFKNETDLSFFAMKYNTLKVL